MGGDIDGVRGADGIWRDSPVPSCWQMQVCVCLCFLCASGVVRVFMRTWGVCCLVFRASAFVVNNYDITAPALKAVFARGCQQQ